MKILLLGGDEKILQANSDSQKRLAGYGYLAEQIYIVIFSAKKIQPRQTGNVFIYSSGGCFRLTALCKGYFLAKKLIKQEKIGAVSSQDPFESALAAWYLRKNCSIKFNIQVHGDFFSQKFWQRQKWLNFFRYYEAVWLLKKADNIRAVSQRIKKSLIDKFEISAEKIIVVPIYADFSSLELMSSVKKPDTYSLEPFVFLIVARLSKEKNLPMVLRVFSKLRQNGRGAVLRIIGEGREREKLEGLARKLKIQDKVEFLGWLNKEALCSEYRIADCFLLASDFEGWGLAPLEAAYFGLPIVMTEVGVCGEIFQPKNDALCSSPRDEQKFLVNMQRVFSDRVLRELLGQNAKAALAKLFTREQTMELYKKAWFT